MNVLKTNVLSQLWNDETGLVLSSEMVLVGTIGVIGATVGLKAIAESVNRELTDVAMAVRSLDQSYSLEGTTGCGASTAGSSFRQQDVSKSLDELCAVVDKEKKAAEKREAQMLKDLQDRKAAEKKHDDDKRHEQKKPEMKKPEPKPEGDKKPEPKKPVEKKGSEKKDAEKKGDPKKKQAKGEVIL
ncbi:MAG: hypothetical protein R3C01_00220 [Planctomycetaceae bacterium]